VAEQCIWIQRGFGTGDVHVSELGITEISAGHAACASCGTEVGRLISGKWYERVRSRRGGDRYTEATPAFLEQFRWATAKGSGTVVEGEVRARE